MRDFLVLRCTHIYVCLLLLLLPMYDDSCTMRLLYEIVHNTKTGIDTHAHAFVRPYMNTINSVNLKWERNTREPHRSDHNVVNRWVSGWVWRCVQFTAGCLCRFTNTTTDRLYIRVCRLCLWRNIWTKSFECVRCAFGYRNQNGWTSVWVRLVGHASHKWRENTRLNLGFTIQANAMTFIPNRSNLTTIG